MPSRRCCGVCGVSVVMEQMATQDFREHYDAMNTTRTLATGYLFMLGLEEWGAVDYSDGFNYLSETATTLGTLALLVCWFLSSSLAQMCPRPAAAHRACPVGTGSRRPAPATCRAHDHLEPRSVLFLLWAARRLLTALLPDGHIINLCGPLPQWPDEEQGAAAPAAAQPTAPAEQADGSGRAQQPPSQRWPSRPERCHLRCPPVRLRRPRRPLPCCRREVQLLLLLRVYRTSSLSSTSHRQRRPL